MSFVLASPAGGGCARAAEAILVTACDYDFAGPDAPLEALAQRSVPPARPKAILRMILDTGKPLFIEA